MKNSSSVALEVPSKVSTPVQAMAKKRARSGLLILTPTMEVRYVSSEAQELCQRLKTFQLNYDSNCMLPRDVIELFQEVLLAVTQQVANGVQSPCEHLRIVGDPQCPMWLRGLGVPDPNGPAYMSIVIQIELMRVRKQYASQQRAVEFRLSKREKSIVDGLIKGFSNKEIAAEQGISEYTVKEYLKRLMSKIGTTSRTGILGRFFNLHEEGCG